MLFKGAGKIVEAGIPQRKGNVGQIAVVALQDLLCFFDPQILYVRDGRNPRDAGEKLSEIHRGKTGDPCKGFVCESLIKILRNEFNDVVNFSLLFRGEVPLVFLLGDRE